MRSPGSLLGRLGNRDAAVRFTLRLIADDRGVTAIEYTLITTLIVMVLVALISQIGDFVSTPFVKIASCL
jgi:Flp pilus assembly pilin Flp